MLNLRKNIKFTQKDLDECHMITLSINVYFDNTEDIKLIINDECTDLENESIKDEIIKRIYQMFYEDIVNECKMLLRLMHYDLTSNSIFAKEDLINLINAIIEKNYPSERSIKENHHGRS